VQNPIPTTTRLLGLVIAAAFTLTLASGCNEEGPAERAGKAIDEAAENVREAGEDLGNEIEDACEEIKQNAGAEDTDC